MVVAALKRPESDINALVYECTCINIYTYTYTHIVYTDIYIYRVYSYYLGMFVYLSKYCEYYSCISIGTFLLELIPGIRSLNIYIYFVIRDTLYIPYLYRSHRAQVSRLGFNYSISSGGQRAGIDLQIPYLAQGVAPAADRGHKRCSLGRSKPRCQWLPPMRFAIAR